MYTKPSTKLFIHFYLKKKTYYQQKKGTYIKKVAQKPYIAGPTQVTNFQRLSPYYKGAAEHRLKTYFIDRNKTNIYNILALSRRYTLPRGRFQLKC